MTGNGVAQAVRGYVFHLQSTIARNNRNRGNRRPLFDVDRAVQMPDTARAPFLGFPKSSGSIAARTRNACMQPYAVIV